MSDIGPIADMSLDELLEKRGHVLATNSQITGGNSSPGVKFPIDIDGDQAIEMPWRLPLGFCDPRHRTVTHEMCNVIRCAVDDGMPYRAIAGLFTFISDTHVAHRHALGDCEHEGGIPPIVSKQRTSGKGGTVTPATCSELRRRYKRGATCKQAGAMFDLHESTAYRHIAEKCVHDNEVQV